MSMGETTLVVVLLVAGVLIWSAVGKLRSGRPDAAFDALQVPAPLATQPIRRGLPWFEIVLALLLLVTTTRAGQAAVAAVALALFGSYLWLIARTLRAREKVSCNCFGSSAVIVNRWTLARNILLVVAVVLLVVRALAGSRSAIGVLAGLDGGGWARLGAAALVTGIVAVIVRAERPPTRNVTVAPAPPPAAPDPDGLDYVRRPTPTVALESLDGTFHLLRDLTGESARLVLFMSPDCLSCHEVEPLVPEWAEGLDPVGLIVAVKNRANAEAMPGHLRGHLWIDHEWAMLKAVGGYGTPSAVLLGADGLLAGGPLSGVDDVRGFVEEIIDQLDAAGVPEAQGVPQTH